MNDERRKVWLERQEELNRKAAAKKIVADAQERGRQHKLNDDTENGLSATSVDMIS